MAFILPFIPLIAAGITAGTSIGLTLSNQPSAGPTPAATPLTSPQGPTTDAAQKTAVTNALPTLQSLTGGSVSPEYAAQWASGATGLNGNPQAGGNIQSAINQFFGLGAPGTSGVSTSSAGATPGNSITELLSRVSLPSAGPDGSSIVNDALHGFGG